MLSRIQFNLPDNRILQWRRYQRMELGPHHPPSVEKEVSKMFKPTLYTPWVDFNLGWNL